MKITLKSLMLRKMESTPLERAVIDNIIYRFSEYKDISVYIKEILHYGCESGCVGNLIYYHDTLEFYEKHKEEINSLLYERLQDISEYDMSKAFRDWDIEDPLAIDIHNQNLLAWFGFEECLYRLSQEWGIEI